LIVALALLAACGADPFAGTTTVDLAFQARVEGELEPCG
jgi:hypothetical protein